MKAIIEHLIVAVIAVGMAILGYWLMGNYNGGQQKFIELHDVRWTVWSSVISVATWFYLYRMCRNLHWLVLPAMGFISPIVGAVLFVIPYLWMPFIVIWTYAPVVFPTGIACGFLVTIATLPFRPREVWHGNA